MFKIGERVVCPAHGGCIVDDIDTKNWEGSEKQFYKLLPIMEESCHIFIPTDRAEERGIRHVISREEAETLLQSLPSLATTWLKDNKERKRIGMETIKGNDLPALVGMVKTYMLMEVEKRTSTTDRELYLAAKKKLVSELALALDDEIASVEQTLSDLAHSGVSKAVTA